MGRQKMLICANCGSTNSNEEKTCKRCGVPLKTTAQSKIKKPRKFIRHHKAPESASQKAEIKIETEKTDKISKNKYAPKVEDEISKKNEPEANKGEFNHLRPIPVGNSFFQRKSNPALIPIKPKDNGKGLIVPHPIRKTNLSKVEVPSSIKPKDKSINKHSKSPQVGAKDSKVRLEKPYIESPKGEKKVQDGFKTAMTQAMRALQRDLGYIFQEQFPKKAGPKNIVQISDSQQNTIPSSLADILESLWDLDLNIEVSSLVHVNGEILALVSSRNIEKSLLSTIGNTLGILSQDMMHSLNSGDLKYISLNGTKGIIFMAPIMKNIFLFLLTTPESKSGVINIAKIRVKKLLTLYFANKNLHKTAL